MCVEPDTSIAGVQQNGRTAPLFNTLQQSFHDCSSYSVSLHRGKYSQHANITKRAIVSCPTQAHGGLIGESEQPVVGLQGQVATHTVGGTTVGGAQNFVRNRDIIFG